MNFVKISDTEIINLDYVATVRKGYSKTDNSFVIYVNTVGEDQVVLKFKTKEAMEEKWVSIRCYLMQNCTATSGKDARLNGATTMAAFGARRIASYCKLDQ